MSLLVALLGITWVGIAICYIMLAGREKYRIDCAVESERNRCADAIRNPEFMHCQGFRMSDRARMAEKIRSGE